MVSYARLPKVTPSGLQDAVYQAGLAARMPALTTIPNPRASYRMTLDAKLLAHIGREAEKWRLGRAEREGLEGVSRAIKADLAERFPREDMDVLDRYGLAVFPASVLVNIVDRVRRDTAWIPIAGVASPERGLAYTANLDGSDPPPRARNARDVPEATIPYFRRLIDVRSEAKDLSREGPGRWVQRFKEAMGRVPRWHEIEKAFPVIAEWLAMRRQARTS